MMGGLYFMRTISQTLQTILSPSEKENITEVAKKCEAFLRYLRHKNDILFLTTSTRYIEHKDDIPKSTQLARDIKKHFPNKRITIIDVPLLNIHPCEGNISSKKGNRCGMQEAVLIDKKKILPAIIVAGHHSIIKMTSYGRSPKFYFNRR